MRKLYLILPILAGFMFGSSGIFVRTLTQNGIDQTTLLFLRFSIAIIPIALAILLTDKKLFRITLSDIPLFILCAICIMGLNLCYNYSMNTIPLSLAAVLLSTAPIFVLIFAFIFFKEKNYPKKDNLHNIGHYRMLSNDRSFRKEFGEFFNIWNNVWHWCRIILGNLSDSFEKISRFRKAHFHNTVLLSDINFSVLNSIYQY